MSLLKTADGRLALQRNGRTLAWFAIDARHAVEAIPDATGWRLDLPAGARLTVSLSPMQHWYGQGEFVHQAYPLDRLQYGPEPLMTWDNGPNGLSCIQESFWLASCGFCVLVEEISEGIRAGMNPPAVNANASGWRPVFETGQELKPLLAGNPDARELVLEFSADTTLRLLAAADAPSALALASVAFGKPTATPPEALLAEPIWTTWAKYKTAIDQHTVLAFARSIREHDYPGCTLEIDDRWQRDYGDSAFDPARFPDPAAMVRALADLGFKVTAWTTPFFSEASANAIEARAAGYLVRDAAGAPACVHWWQGDAYLLDVSSPAARAWWADKLTMLQRETGLAGYKFDAGEANFVPADARMHRRVERSEYSQLWAAFAAEHFPYGEARCGWRGQRNNILYRQWDKFSVWGLDNGLTSVLSGALNLGLSGYPFILPDIIGGNAYGNSVSAELMIRWTQACAPMLAMQFSIPPWDLGAEADAICHRYARLHVELLPRRLAAARQALASGAPVVRPLFWCAPHDAETYAIGDQYLLGDDLLVAPVLTEGMLIRDIYLPEGCWRDWWSGAEFAGGRWLRGFAAPLALLPLFEKTG
jgi:alpha-glucosidase (family GH31 glycosyl hydrolase)